MINWVPEHLTFWNALYCSDEAVYDGLSVLSTHISPFKCPLTFQGLVLECRRMKYIQFHYVDFYASATPCQHFKEYILEP